MHKASPNAESPVSAEEGTPSGHGDSAGSVTDRVGALGALYQGEKTDAVGIFGVAMTMMGIAAAYLVGVSAFADKYGSHSIPWTFVLLLPAPLWLIVIFHSLITLSAMRHGESVQIIEDELFRESGLASHLRNKVGSKAGNRIMDITQARPVHKIATVCVYGGFFLGVILYTVYVVVQARHNVDAWSIGIAIAGYFIALIIAAASWIRGLFPGNEDQGTGREDDSQKDVHAPLGRDSQHEAG